MVLRMLPCLVFVLLLLGTAGCSEREGSPDREAQASLPEAAADQHGAAAAESLPLLPIMLQMAADMSGLMQALWLENYEQMSARAAAVAGHAGIAAEELARIEAELGPEMAAFVAADEAVHQASVRLHEAAEARELDVFVEQLAEVQRGCVDCHSRFRERLSTRQP
jgi:hypothetical protein